MANEARVVSSLTIKIGNNVYQNSPQSYQADVSKYNGPTPGCITATTVGTIINLTQLTKPGLCHLRNLDTVNSAEVGIYDNNTGKFYPMLLFLPGEGRIERLSDFLGHQLGTGTHLSSDVTFLMVRAINQALDFLVEAFDT